jgi:hypothetical protein
MKLFLNLLLAFVALTSIVSGALLVASPDGSLFHTSTVILKSTPFSSFLIPGLILCILVGGSNLVALVFNLRSHPLRFNATIAGGIVLIGWTFVQMFLIGVSHWLQFVYLGIGLMILLLSGRFRLQIFFVFKIFISFSASLAF